MASMPSPMYQGPDYRHILVNSTADVRFYHFNPEHSTANANAEFRGSKTISVFGTKSEGPSATIWVRDCEDVLHTGHAGNAAPIACAPENSLRGCDWTAGTPSLFRVEGCRGNCRFGNLWTCAPARARLRPATPANCAAHLCSQTSKPTNSVWLSAGENSLATAPYERPAVVATSDTLSCVRSGAALECEHKGR